MSSKIEVEIELKTPSQKLWKNLREFVLVFPKALPHLFEKIDVIEGDGTSVGSVFVSTLKPSESNPAVGTKQRIGMVDEEKKMVSYIYVEGGMLEKYKNFKITLCVSSNKNDGSMIKYTAEFDKANAELPDPYYVADNAVKLFHDLDDYLLKA